MTIKEIEAATGLPRANVRYYESLGLIHPARAANGYRDYRQEDLDTLLKIKLLRQLDCPLEDIQALERGERTLDQVLSEVGDALEKKAAETHRALELYHQLRADHPSWDDLQPERYLAWNPPASALAPVADAADDLGSRCPWRRNFARSLDYALCLCLWELFLCLALRVNILSPSVGLQILNVAVALGLMCVLEPMFLHFFGATPGKALFGLRLTRSDGSFFRYSQGLLRTFHVIIYGLGLMVPLITVITQSLSLRRCRRLESQPWALEDEAWSDPTGGKLPFWAQRGSALRVAGYLGCQAAITALLIFGILTAAAPRHQGALTAQEFADNYNHLRAYASAPDVPYDALGADGSWHQSATNAVVLHLDGLETPRFHFTLEDDRLTQVSFSVSGPEQGVICASPAGYAIRALHALLGERELLPGPTLSAIDRELEALPPGETTWHIDGWDVTCQITVAGYHRWEQMLFPAEGERQELAFFCSIQSSQPAP